MNDLVNFTLFGFVVVCVGFAIGVIVNWLVNQAATHSSKGK